MKVLFCHDHTFLMCDGFFYSYGSYPESYWKRYLEFCAEVRVLSKYNISTVSEKNGYVKSFSLNNGLVNFIGVKKIPIMWRLNLPFGLEWEKISKEIKEADFVVCRMPSDLGCLVAEFCIRNNVPYSVEMVGEVFGAYYDRGTLLGKIYAPIAEWKTRKIIKKAKGALYVSNKLSELYKVPDTVKRVIATNAVIDRVSTHVDILSRVKRMEDESYTPKIGLIGSYYVDYKGIDLAIQAVASLYRMGYVFSLHILGGGNANKYLELANKLGVERLIVFDDLLPAGEAVRNWLLNCDYYIQPSRQEGLPRGLLEAMSTGLPAVGSTAGAMPDLLPSGFIHEKNNAIDLAEKIKNMLELDYITQAEKSLSTASQYHFDFVNDKRRSFYKSVFQGV